MKGTWRKDRCPRCQASRFHLKTGFVKPVFVCTTGCGHEWAWGRDGGEFFGLATNSEGTSPSDWTGISAEERGNP